MKMNQPGVAGVGKLIQWLLPGWRLDLNSSTLIARNKIVSAQGKTYLALGDSMSIDDYTGVEGGGAVKQFHRWLGDSWVLDDRTSDGCQMAAVPTDATGDVITITIGGNDLLWNKEEYLAHGLSGFSNEHLRLLQRIRATNPASLLIVGNIYHPDAELTEREYEGFMAANRAIQSNCLRVGAKLAKIFNAFRGNEAEYLCFQIEPTLKGATAFAELFRRLYEEHEQQTA